MEKWGNGEGGLWDRARAASGHSACLAMAVLATGVLTAACTSGRADYSRIAPTGIAPGDAIAVILYDFSGRDYSRGREYSLDLEEKVVTCISKAIREIAPTVQIVPPEEFRRVAFQDLTLAELPAGEEQWIALAADAAFRERVTPLNLRYAIGVKGFAWDSSRSDWWRALGYGGGQVWERNSVFHATILDVKRAAVVGSVDATATGEIAFFRLVVPPTETRACNELGEQVARFLVGE